MKLCVSNTEACGLTLKARSENIVNIPTNYKGLGFLDKTELSPGIFLAASLTRGENGVYYQYCKLNRTGPEGRFTPGSLRGSGRGEGSLTFALSAVAGSDSRLSSLRNQLRLQHLNGE